MVERLSEGARLTVQGALQEAVQLESSAIGTEHLLLSLLTEGGATTGKTLEQLAISPESIRQGVLTSAVPRPPRRRMAGTSDPPGHVPFTPEAEKVFQHAQREALKLGHGYIGAEHVLLGLIRERHSLAGRVLADLGADLDTARGFVAGLVEKHGPPPGVPAEWIVPKPSRGQVLGRFRRRDHAS